MSPNFETEFEALGAGAAASILARKRDVILGFVDRENPVLADAFKAAIEKAEPGGMEMALVKGALNKILDGLEDEEKAAVPQTAVGFIDWLIARLGAIAQPS